MPYVIVHRYADCDFPESCGECEISRREVATIADGARAVGEILNVAYAGNEPAVNVVIREHGTSTIGPLPDGTVIVVEPVTAPAP